MGLIIYVSLLKLTPKILILPLILKTMLSCPGLTPTQHFTNSLTAWSVEHSLLINGRLPMVDISTSRKFFLQVCEYLWQQSYVMPLFIWRHITVIKSTGATCCTLTMDIMWLLILLIHFLCSMKILLHIRQIGLDIIVFTWCLSNMEWGYMINYWEMTSNIYCPNMLGTREPSPEVSQQIITVIGNTYDFCLRKYAI